MSKFMSINEIVSATRNDVARQIKKGTMKRLNEHCTDNDENFNTISSLYSQWAEDQIEADEAIMLLFIEEFPDYI